MKILFIVFPQRSHFNAMLPLAKDLARAGHEMVFAGCEELRTAVEACGFAFVKRERDVFPFVEEKPNGSARAQRSILKWFRACRRLDAYRRVRMEIGDLRGLVAKVRPDIALIDRAYSVFCPALFGLGLPFGILVSMGNLNRSPGLPPQCTTYVPSGTWADKWISAFHWHSYFVGRFFEEWVTFRMEFDRTFLRQIEAACPLIGFRFDQNRYFHPGIRQVPEFLLFPREFDFPRSLAPNQYYVGHALNRNRVDSAVDFGFARCWKRFCAERLKGTPIIYCGFGTAAWRYPAVTKFVRMLIELSQRSHWNLVVAVGGAAKAELGRLSRHSNILVCETVPQLDVLAESDLIVCHGGMNSVMESITAGVPMLVCPGMRNSDQPGNAARVCFHGLGNKFNCRVQGGAELRQTIEQLLSDGRYRRRVEQMRAAIQSRNSHASESIVIDALAKHWPGLSGVHLAT